jgi:protein SCO1/2
MAPRRRTPNRRTPHAEIGAVIAVAAGLLLLAGAYLWVLGGTAPRPAAAIGGPFRLTQENGQVVTDRDFRGRFLLIYFGYTECPDVCPTTLAAVADAIDRLGARAVRLQPVFITVDPARDQPAAVRRFADAYSPRILGLGGTPAQIAAIEQAFRISSRVQTGRPDAAAYTVDHTSVLLLVGPDGRYLAPLPAIESGAEIAARLAPYLS